MEPISIMVYLKSTSNIYNKMPMGLVNWKIYFEFQPITPTDAKPDMSSLRLIKESELRRGGIIGSGAFGTVYKVIYLI